MVSKTRSKGGRKGWFDEAQVKSIIDKSSEIVLNALNKKGDFKNIEPSIRLEIAARFAIKAIPQNTPPVSDSLIDKFSSVLVALRAIDEQEGR